MYDNYYGATWECKDYLEEQHSGSERDEDWSGCSAECYNYDTADSITETCDDLE